MTVFLRSRPALSRLPESQRRFLAHALVMLSVVCMVLLLQSVRSIGVAKELNWFDFNADSSCAARQPGCGALIAITGGTVAWLPLLINGCLALASLLAEPATASRRIWILHLSLVALGGVATVIALVDVGLVVRWPWLLWLPVAIAAATSMGRALVRSDSSRGPKAEDGTETSHPGLQALWTSVSPLRIHLAVLLGYALFMLVIPQTAGQAIDAVRVWGLASLPATLAGLGTALLLTWCMKEAGRSTEAAFRRKARPFRADLWFAAGYVAFAVGALFWKASDVGYGIIIFGCIVMVMGLLGIRWRPVSARRANTPRDTHAPGDPSDASEDSSRSASKESPLGPWLLTAPLLILACALATAGYGDAWIDQRISQVERYVLVAACILSGAAMSVCGRSRTAQTEPHAAGSRLGSGREKLRGREATLLALGLAVATALALHAAPVATGQLFGTLAFVNVTACVLVVVGDALVELTARSEPPRFLSWINIRRLPILAPLLAWWVVAGLALPSPMHSVPLHQREAIDGTALAELDTPTLEDAFEMWTAAQPELNARTSDETTPLVIVASHGGGIRAAYWTGLVLDCMVRAQPVPMAHEKLRGCDGESRSDANIRRAARRLFLASGVSGGSVGLAAYAQHMLSSSDLSDATWVSDRLGKDFAAPTIGWGLFHDLPNHFVGVAASSGQCESRWSVECQSRDRSSTLDETLDPGDTPLLRGTWDQRLSSTMEERAKATTVPLLAFNTTLVGAKFGAIVSAAKLGQQRLNPDLTAGYDPTADTDSLPLSGQIEAIDLLCDDTDIAISTAAFLSARFPVVSPSGSVGGQCASMRKSVGAFTYNTCHTSHCDMSMVDGGYLDNSGLLTISGLMPELTRLVTEFNEGPRADIALVVVDIDSGYKSRDVSATNPSVAESLVPVESMFVRGAVERHARARVVRSVARNCMITVAPAFHPGLTAPLGWSLSPSTMGELERALDDPTRVGRGSGQGRRKNLLLLQRWLGTSYQRELAAIDLARCAPGVNDSDVAAPPRPFVSQPVRTFIPHLF